MYLIFVEKSTSDYIYDNIPNSSVTSPPAEEQSQVIRQQQQEPLSDDQMSSAECSRKDNGVTPTIAMTTHEISTAEKTHPNEQPSCDDDVMNICKVIIRKFHFRIRSMRQNRSTQQETHLDRLVVLILISFVFISSRIMSLMFSLV